MSKITFKCSNGDCAAEESTLRPAELVSAMIVECGLPLVVPLPDFDVDTVLKALEFLDHHASEPFGELEAPLREPLSTLLSAWDRAFLSNTPTDSLLRVLLLATYLGIGPLRQICSAHIAALVGSTPDADIPSLFGVAVSEDELAQIARDIPWLAE